MFWRHCGPACLLEKTGAAPATWRHDWRECAECLRDRLDAMFPESPQTAGILRAMLLGDRSFVDRSESVDFQKTGVFHVLVVAGLHVGALAFFLFWLARKLRLPPLMKTLFVLAALFLGTWRWWSSALRCCERG